MPADNIYYFVKRETLVKQIHDEFNNASIKQRLVISALSGLGGIGKTQLAIYYLHHSEYLYNQRFWFRAENHTTLCESYYQLGLELKLFLADDEPDVKPSEEKIIRYVKRYLEQSTNWLAIYDNAGVYDELNAFLPTQGGHVVVTTRRSDWGDVGQELVVLKFTKPEAISYFKKATNQKELTAEEEKAAATLAEAVGCLPLALAQASKYIKNAGITVQDYIKHYQARKKELLESKLLPAGYHGEPVATTWKISFIAIEIDEKAAKEPPITLLLLQAMAYFQFENIPRALLEQIVREAGYAKDEITATDLVNAAIGHLRAYSLIQTHVAQKTVSLHPLLQEIIQFFPLLNITATTGDAKASTETKSFLSLKDFTHEKWLVLLSDAIVKEFKRETTPLADEVRQRILSPHIKKLFSHVEPLLNSSSKPDASFANLSHTMGYMFFEFFDHPENAKFFFELALKIKVGCYDINDWRLGNTLNGLANAWGCLGQTRFKKILLEHARTLQEAHYGKEHEEVAITLASLADVVGELGDINQQRTLLVLALKIQESRGPNYWQLAATLNNLANTLDAPADAEKKKNLLKRALEVAEFNYGENHSQVATPLINYASAWGALSEYKLEKDLLERALKIQETNYGPNHILVAITIDNLATTYGQLGDFNNKKELLKKALKILETHHGYERFETAIILLHLAYALNSVNERVEAYQRATEACRIFILLKQPQHLLIQECQTLLGQLKNILNDEEQVIIKQAESLQALTSLQLSEKQADCVIVSEPKLPTMASSTATHLSSHSETKTVIKASKEMVDIYSRIMKEHQRVAVQFVGAGSSSAAVVSSAARSPQAFFESKRQNTVQKVESVKPKQSSICVVS